MNRTSSANPKQIPAGEAARLRAGFTIEGAARRLGVGAKHLREIEKRGGASFKLARNIHRLYGGASGNVFLLGPAFSQSQEPFVTAQHNSDGTESNLEKDGGISKNAFVSGKGSVPNRSRRGVPILQMVPNAGDGAP